MERKPLLLALAMAVVGFSACDEETVEPPASTMFRVRVENVSTVYDFSTGGSFTVPMGASDAGPALPGDAYEVEFAAAPGTRLSFATMFVQSNDFFYAPDEEGIALFDESGTPVSGDVTDQVQLWDGGTEANQEPGLGPDQAPRQGDPDTGAPDDESHVRVAPDEFDNLPSVAEVIRVMLTAQDGNRFVLRVENVSSSSTLATSDGGNTAVPLSPGVWVVHTEAAPLFTAGEPDRGDGLQAIAEDGDAAMLALYLADRTGLTSPLSPGAYAVHTDGMPLFTEGEADRGEGLEAVAEDADPTELGMSLQDRSEVTQAGVFNVPEGADEPGPILPGNAFEFMLMAAPGQRLSLATMLGQSNDLFYAPADSGVALFDGDTPREGDVTAEFLLWDAGTELNETPGAGPNQAPRQAAPGDGAEENGSVRSVDDEFEYPATDAVLRVTLTPEGS